MRQLPLTSFLMCMILPISFLMTVTMSVYIFEVLAVCLSQALLCAAGSQSGYQRHSGYTAAVTWCHAYHLAMLRPMSTSASFIACLLCGWAAQKLRFSGSCL